MPNAQEARRTVRAIAFAALALGGATACSPVQFEQASTSIASKGGGTGSCSSRSIPLDLMIVQDSTASMTPTISEVEESMTALVSETSRLASSSRFGLATFQDWPETSGDSSDVPYVLEQPLTSNAALVRASIGTVVADGGGDRPESDLEALYRIATSSEIGWAAGSKRVAVVLTDAPMKNPPAGRGYSRADVKAALVAARIVVIGIAVDSGAVADLTDMAAATGGIASNAIDLDGDGRSDTPGVDLFKGAALVFPFSPSKSGGLHLTLAQTIAAGLTQVACN